MEWSFRKHTYNKKEREGTNEPLLQQQQQLPAIRFECLFVLKWQALYTAGTKKGSLRWKCPNIWIVVVVEVVVEVVV